MVADDIIKLGKMLGAKKFRVNSDSVSMNCPFAKWTHDDGWDSKPSFGISIGRISVFHCFTCGMKGRLTYLPSLLWRFYGRFPKEIRDFIAEYDYVPILPPAERTAVYECYDKLISYYSQFKSANPICNLTPSDIEKWDIRYDREKDALVFPIYDAEKRLVALKGRTFSRKRGFFYYDGSNNVKRLGIWYGMHFPVKRKKVILCEGERDAIFLSRYGIDTWASLGASITKEQIATLKKAHYEFVLFFDNDKAGKEATEKIIKECKVFNTLYIIRNYYGCKDPAEVVEKGNLMKCLRSIKKA